MEVKLSSIPGDPWTSSCRTLTTFKAFFYWLNNVILETDARKIPQIKHLTWYFAYKSLWNKDEFGWLNFVPLFYAHGCVHKNGKQKGLVCSAEKNCSKRCQQCISRGTGMRIREVNRVKVTPDSAEYFRITRYQLLQFFIPPRKFEIQALFPRRNSCGKCSINGAESNSVCCWTGKRPRNAKYMGASGSPTGSLTMPSSVQQDIRGRTVLRQTEPEVWSN